MAATSSIHRLRAKPVSILGLKLRQFCLGHYLALAAEDVSYVSDHDASPTMEDLVFGAFVCSLTWEEYNSMIDSDSLAAEVERWALAVSLEIVKPGVLAGESKRFSDYIREATASPKYWIEGDGAARPSGIHWALAMKATLTGKLGYSRSESLNVPFAESLSDYLAQAESAGTIRLWTDDEERSIAALETEAANG
jgi:hypothetical protein